MDIKEIPSHVGARYELVENFLADPNALDRLNSGEVTSLWRAAILGAALHVPGLPDKLRKRQRVRLDMPYIERGYTILGRGYHATVLEDGDKSVRKIFPGTRGMKEALQAQYIARTEAKQAIITDNLGPIAVRQHFEVQQDPLDSNSTIVAAMQPKVEGKDVTRLGSNIARLTPDWKNFLFGAAGVLEQKAAPDLAGVRNLLIDERNRLRLIDPVAVLKDDSIDNTGYNRSCEILQPYL